MGKLAEGIKNEMAGIKWDGWRNKTGWLAGGIKKQNSRIGYGNLIRLRKGQGIK